MVGNPSIHEFDLPALKGGKLSLDSFKGKKILIVNTASECGFTGQYAQMQELHERYSDKVAVIGCPSNDFGKQEPGNDEEIATFCAIKYGVSFPMSAKLSVKGSTMHPVYGWLLNEAKSIGCEEVSWNFQKFLLDENGKLTHVFPPAESVFDPAVLSAMGLD